MEMLANGRSVSADLDSEAGGGMKKKANLPS